MAKLDTNFQWIVPFIYGYGSNTNGKSNIYEVRITPFVIVTWKTKVKKSKLPKVGKGEILEYRDGYGNWYHYDEHLQQNSNFLPIETRVRKIQ